MRALHRHKGRMPLFADSFGYKRSAKSMVGPATVSADAISVDLNERPSPIVAEAAAKRGNSSSNMMACTKNNLA